MTETEGLITVGSVKVSTTVDRAHTPEELADMCLAKLIYISADAPPEIRDQALAFQEKMRPVLEFFMRQAAFGERSTIIAALERGGMTDIADVLRQEKEG